MKVEYFHGTVQWAGILTNKIEPKWLLGKAKGWATHPYCLTLNLEFNSNATNQINPKEISVFPEIQIKPYACSNGIWSVASSSYGYSNWIREYSLHSRAESEIKFTIKEWIL